MIGKRVVSRLHVPHHKNTAAMHSVAVPPPDRVVIPLQMHSGGVTVPVVQPGDHVYRGQVIGAEQFKVGVPIHATVSGTVKSIEDVVILGRKTSCVIIDSDGKMEMDPTIAPPKAENLDEFLAALRASGIVGLGGAAYPTWAKLDALHKSKVRTFLINGAECEPYLTSDTRTMLENGEDVRRGVELLKKFSGAEEYVIGIEKNKPEAIAHMNEIFADDPQTRVMVLDSVYPQGAKQVFLYNVSGLVVEAGQRLASLGALIINVTTLACVGRYFEDGVPLLDRCVTVDGSAVAKPGNFIVPVGTTVRYILEQAGGFKEEPGKVIIGGPMMGKTVASLDEPIVRATGGVLAFNKADSKAMEPSECIHCGRCVDNCPLKLNPTAYADAMEMEDLDAREALLTQEQVNVCMECGCCSYVCPANRPLVQNNIAGKAFLRSRRPRQ